MDRLGNLAKMNVELAHPVQYSLVLDDQLFPLNHLLGEQLSLHFMGEINCVHCSRKTSKSFNQGYCYPCFSKLAQCDICIVRPERCHYYDDTCREPDWAEQHCLQPHYVYLANSSGIKVGITRHNQIPTRWIDQGAVAALPIMKVSSRLVSGLLETELKQHVSDKTNWQRMLKGNIEPVDLVEYRETLIDHSLYALEDITQQFGADAITILDDETPVEINYPVNRYPDKVKSLNFDKTPKVSGVLQGIKGQYLIFDTGVINIRKFGGYKVRVIHEK
jgi:hypothetical protein